MPALNTARSRPPLRLVAKAERKPASKMPVTVGLPEGFSADVDSMTARIRQVQTSTRGFTTTAALVATVKDLLAIEALAREAREKLG